jgi:CRISPR-associated endonuclease/helicase Cas3
LGRIIYCLPYTSIIDQNYDEFKKIIQFAKKGKFFKRPERYLLKHHHLSFKTLKNRKEALEEHKKIIVVSTQLIEAGVDLSFKFVYRDFGPLDCIIQVAAGRCNRNGEYGELGGQFRLLRLIDENQARKPYHHYVYKPILIQHVEQTLNKKFYESKDFSDLSTSYFEKFEFTDKAEKLLAAICDLNYDNDVRCQIPVKKFKLIDEYSEETIYILVTLEAEQEMKRLLICKKQIQEEGISKEEKEVQLYEIEKLKAALKTFQISSRKQELEAYKNSMIIEEKERYTYISHDNQKKYAYDPCIGFLTIPKTEISLTISF